MKTVDDFTRGYITCMLWAETDDADESGGEPLDENYTPEDLDPEALEQIKTDCRLFREQNQDDLDAYPALRRCPDGEEYTGAELAGHDFWLTRNGHGTGFWDRDYLPEGIGKRLTEAAEAFGEAWIYVGDEGKLHV